MYLRLVVVTGLLIYGLLGVLSPLRSAVVQPRYYAFPAVHDTDGVIASRYTGGNGPFDERVRIAMDTLKRYPWTEAGQAPITAPHHVYSGQWRIDAASGAITIPELTDWNNGDWGQRAANTLIGLADYYRYSGDAHAIAQMQWIAEAVCAVLLTPDDHDWPRFPVTVPVKGKPYGQAEPRGYIQLDIAAELGMGMIRAWQLTGDRRWWQAVTHWGDLFALHRNRQPGRAPWLRYANPQDTLWPGEPQMTGGIVFILEFLNELVANGYTGRNGAIVQEIHAGDAWLRLQLLPRWLDGDTWGRNYWDWPNPVQAENVTEYAARYLMTHANKFPQWRTDARNIMMLFLHNTSVDGASGGEVYSGAWAYPESSSCCGRSLWYGPMELATVFAEYGVRTRQWEFAEIALRKQTLAAYDAHPNGWSEDNIDGGSIVCADWFKIAHPMALKHLLHTMAWLPDRMGPQREDHIMRASVPITRVVYRPGEIVYDTHRAPAGVQEVVRTGFRPERVLAGGKPLPLRREPLHAPGYALTALPYGDWLVTVRHDGQTTVRLQGPPQRKAAPAQSAVATGGWKSGASGRVESETTDSTVTFRFRGTSFRLIGPALPDGGLADVEIDGASQLAPLDACSPRALPEQTLYTRSGLAEGEHTVRVRVRGMGNPRSTGAAIRIDRVEYGSAPVWTDRRYGQQVSHARRLVYGRPHRDDYVDDKGNTWRPALEVVTRRRVGAYAVDEGWWREPYAETVTGPLPSELYRYGMHAPEIITNVTVGPGRYSVVLHFASVNRTKASPVIDVRVNGQLVAEAMDIWKTAGGMNRGFRLTVPNVRPRNGVIDVTVCSAGASAGDPDCTVDGDEATLHALEVAPGDVAPGVTPVRFAGDLSGRNLLRNPGFERGSFQAVCPPGWTGTAEGWTGQSLGPGQAYLYVESAYIIHPDWGLPEYHCGQQALRTHADAQGTTRVWQDAPIRPGIPAEAAVWVRCADNAPGKGFGAHPDDRAALIVDELDAEGRIVRSHLPVERRTPGPYTRLAIRFEPEPSTRMVRVILEAAQHAPYYQSHVTWDDASLVQR